MKSQDISDENQAVNNVQRVVFSRSTELGRAMRLGRRCKSKWSFRSDAQLFVPWARPQNPRGGKLRFHVFPFFDTLHPIRCESESQAKAMQAPEGYVWATWTVNLLGRNLSL